MSINDMFGVVHLPLILGTTHIKDFIYEVRFSDSTRKRIDFKTVDVANSNGVVEESGCHADFGKTFILKTSSGDTVEISSIFLHSI